MGFYGSNNPTNSVKALKEENTTTRIPFFLRHSAMLITFYIHIVVAVLEKLFLSTSQNTAVYMYLYFAI